MLATIGGVETETRTRPLPDDLKGFRNYHADDTIVVCGCGSSLTQLVAPHRFVTIGVNDVGRLFQPDYLVVLNPKHQFSGDRYRYVEESRATAVFSQMGLRLPSAPVIPVRLGRRGGVDNIDPDVLHYTRNSPYLATCLAMHMGARRIGLIGVDFTDHHFFASTGQHSLMGEFEQIDREYKRLGDECARRGIEVVNLSAESRLSAFPKVTPEQFAVSSLADREQVSHWVGRRVFFVNYRFLSCGEVFRNGLEAAAKDLRVEYQSTNWDDAELPEKVRQFSPELLFVVHGRRFQQRWRSEFANYNSAVWLLDEPYEVDDTSRISKSFRTVFVNDPSTRHRHQNAHYLPVCYDPHACSYPAGGARPHRVGFIGGANPEREKVLSELASRGLLSYVVGGPWHTAALRSLNLAPNIPAERTTALYRETKIVLNIFRTQHHFDHEHTSPFSLNPRVYEAAGCGALPISEPRPELSRLWPEAPVFRGAEQLESLLTDLRDDPAKIERLLRSGVRNLRGHTYAARLNSAMLLTLEARSASAPHVVVSKSVQPAIEGWELSESVMCTSADGGLILEKENNDGAGSEEGLAGVEARRDVALEFEVFLEPGARFLAKIHQQESRNQSSNSYHLFASDGGAIVARHHHIFSRFAMPQNSWIKVKMIFRQSRLVVRIDGEVLCSTHDGTLPEGYCFLGIKGGRVRLRGITVSDAKFGDVGVGRLSAPPSTVLAGSPPQEKPLVSIVTTVYDRAECLDRCLRSVNALTFQDYEHIVVADSPPSDVVEKMKNIVDRRGGARQRMLANLRARHNNWGIAPAAAGLAMASGKYVAFLSDDNGYLSDHFEPLLEVLERDPGLGFAYSSCMYAARAILRRSPPRFGGIDLGQPVFRKEVLDAHFGGGLPFTEAAWDWRMIEQLIRKGTRWKHVDRLTFVFRLDKYPNIVAALP